MTNRLETQKGFTIVELLIVVVVIAILAAITIVAYNGIQQRATRSALQSEVSQAAKKVFTTRSLSGQEAFPLTAADAGISAITGTLKYVYEPLTNAFCVQSTKATLAYFATSSNGSAQEGDCSDSTTGMIGWWKLNNDTSDASSNGNTGVGVSQTFVIGQNNQTNGAANFNGTTSGIKVAHTAALSNDMQTISLWVNPAAAPTTNIVYAAKRSAAGNGWLLATNASTLFFDCGGSGRRYVPNSILTPNKWSHLVAICSASGQMAMYVDGESLPVSTVTGIRTALVTTSGPLTIGIDSLSDQYYFPGSIDDVRIYNRTLDQSDIQALYSRGAK